MPAKACFKRRCRHAPRDGARFGRMLARYRSGQVCCSSRPPNSRRGRPILTQPVAGPRSSHHWLRLALRANAGGRRRGESPRPGSDNPRADESKRRYLARWANDRLPLAPRSPFCRRKAADLSRRCLYVRGDRGSAKPLSQRRCVSARQLAEHARSPHRRRALTRSVERSRSRTLRAIGLRLRHSSQACFCKHLVAGRTVGGARLWHGAFSRDAVATRRSYRARAQPILLAAAKAHAHRVYHDSGFQRGVGRVTFRRDRSRSSLVAAGLRGGVAYGNPDRGDSDQRHRYACVADRRRTDRRYPSPPGYRRGTRRSPD